MLHLFAVIPHEVIDQLQYLPYRILVEVTAVIFELLNK